MANTIKIKRGSGSDPAASDMVLGEPVLRTDTAELFFKKDDGSVAKVSGGGGGPDFKYLALRNAANNGAASYPNADFTLVTSGTTTAKIPSAANTLLVSVNGVIQKPNTGTSTPSAGFAISGSTIKFAANISAAPDFILYQESGGIGEPSDETVSEAKLQVSNSPVNGYFLSAQSGNTGGLTWAAPVATSCTGNSATATALATARAINGVNFDGTAAITVTAAAGTLSGTTLNSSVVTSSLTSLGDLSGLTVNGDMALTGANYNVLWDKSDNALEFADSAKATFGTGADFSIYHDGTNSIQFFDSQVGAVRFRTDIGNSARANLILGAGVDLYYNNSKKFETTSTGVKLPISSGGDGVEFFNSGDIYAEIVGNMNRTLSDKFLLSLAGKWNNNHMVGKIAIETGDDTTNKDDGRIVFHTAASGGNVAERLKIEPNGNIQIPDDNKKLQLGASQDLQLFHDGSNSYIQNATGNLIFKSSTANFIKNIVSTGAVELNFNNSKKFETVTGGATITGVCTATSFAGDGSNLTGVGGATGGGSDEIFYENSQTITTDYTITSNKNAMSAGPITINNGVSVTVPSGSTYTIV